VLSDGDVKAIAAKLTNEFAKFPTLDPEAQKRASETIRELDHGYVRSASSAPPPPISAGSNPANSNPQQPDRFHPSQSAFCKVFARTISTRH
jgi:hypothetical protein